MSKKNYTPDDVERIIKKNNWRKPSVSPQKTDISGEAWTRASKSSTQIPKLEQSSTSNSRSGLNTEEIIPYLEESTAKDKNTVIKPNSGMIYGGSSFGTSTKNNDVNIGVSNPLSASYNGNAKGISIGTIDDASGTGISRFDKLKNSGKIAVDLLFGDAQGNTGIDYLLNKGLRDAAAEDGNIGASTIKNISDSAESLVKNALYNFPGAKMVVKATDKYIDPIFGTNLADAEGLENEVGELNKEHKISSVLGSAGGNIAGYFMGSQLMNAIPAVSNITGQAANTIANATSGGMMSKEAVQAGATHLQNILGDTALDIALDTIPTLTSMAENGSSGSEIAREAATNTLKNLSLNALGESAQMLFGEAKNALRSRKEAKQAAEIPYVKNTDEFAGQTVKQTADGMKNVTDPVEKAIHDPNVLHTHTTEELSKMNDYLNSSDDGIIKYAYDVRALKGNEKIYDYPLSNISSRQAEDIKKLTGIDTSGNKVVLDKGTIQHIDSRHGINGKADHSMADDATLSRIQYVLDNYDEVGVGKTTKKLMTKDGKKAPTVIFQKKVDGQYYVIEAVTDAESKTNRIVSAYTSNKKVVDGMPTTKATNPMVDADIVSPLPRTSEIGSDSVTNNILPTNSENVKIPALGDGVNFVDDVAILSSKKREIPKSTVQSTNKFSSLDRDMTELVELYGDDSDIEKLLELRKAINGYGNGKKEPIEYMNQISFIEEEIENSISAKKNIRSNSSTVQEIPYVKSQEELSSNDYFDTFLAGGKPEPQTEIPFLKEPEVDSGEYVTKTATNTLANSELFRNNAEMRKILQEEIDSGRMTFRTVKEDESIKAAKDSFKRDPVAETERLMSSDSWKEAKDFDGGMMLLKSASDSGDYDTVRHMARKVASEGHDAGVRLQALDKYSRTAEGTIAKAQSVLDKQIKKWTSNSINDAAEAKRVSDLLKSEIQSIAESASYQDIESAVKSIIGESKISNQITDQDISEISRMLKKGYASDIENTIDTILATQQYGISDETIKAVQNIFYKAAKFGENSKQRVKLENQAYALLADEITTSNWKDKWDTWRYLSMLSKPATHERNIIGNVGMNVVSGVKNNIAAALESTVDAVSPNGIQRTKSILNPLSGSDRSLISSAAKDADEVAYRALSGSKYGAKSGIEGQAKAFRSGSGKLIQKIADKNSTLLEVEDYAGLKAKYSTSLAGYLKANKLDVTIFDATDDASKAVLDKAREYAISEAKKATFHEESTFADALSKFSQNMRNSDNVRNKAIGAMIEGVVPFKKTPINIVKTAGRYSPLSIADAVFNKLPKALKSSGKNAGKYTVSQAIDSLASGLTGTGIMMLGAYMGSKGLIRGKGTGDEAQDSFDQLRGQQNYSIQFGDGSYTIDWMAPSVLPLLVGVELQKAWEDKGNIDSSELFNSIASLADPIVETTMMSGVSNALSNVRYSDSDTDVLSSFATGLATGYATQGIPSTLGAVARAVDNTRRDSSGTQKGVLGQLEYTLNSTKNKIPVLSDQSPEYRDAWGRTQENFSGGDGSLVSNLAYHLFSPGYYSEDKTTSNDTYLQGLYDKTGESDVLPKKVRRSYNGEKIDPYTYSRVQKSAGQKSYELIDYLRTSDRSGMSDVMQAEIIPDLYSYAKDVALDNAGIKHLSGTNEKLAKIEKEHGSNALITYLSISKMEGSGSSGGLVKDDWIDYLDASDLTPLQKAYIFNLKYPKSKDNPFD